VNYQLSIVNYQLKLAAKLHFFSIHSNAFFDEIAQKLPKNVPTTQFQKVINSMQRFRFIGCYTPLYRYFIFSAKKIGKTLGKCRIFSYLCGSVIGTIFAEFFADFAK
jgi:hypothetical protein